MNGIDVIPASVCKMTKTILHHQRQTKSKNTKIMKKRQIKRMSKFVITAFSSMVSGAVIGLLFAPDKGSDTRKKLSRKSDEYLKNIRDDLKQLRMNLNKRTEKGMQKINEIGEHAKDKGEEILKLTGKMTSYDEWTKEKLTERAKSTGLEGYSTMNKEELIDALRNR